MDQIRYVGAVEASRTKVAPALTMFGLSSSPRISLPLTASLTDMCAPSLENSRKMKEKSHRASQRCYRSGSETFLSPNARRLDGYSLYTASHVRIRAQREAGRRGLRHAARQFGRRGGAAEEPRYPVAADQACGRLSGRWASAGQDRASNSGVAPAARLRTGVWLRRLQRGRAA